MHIRQVRFERVFDVQASGGLFSFAADGKTHYSVTLPDAVVPQAGEQFAMVLLREDDWSTVIAHRNLSEQATKVHLRISPRWALVELIGDWYIMGLVLPALAFAIGMSVSAGVGAIAALVVLLAQLLASGAYVERLKRRNDMAKQALLALAADSPGTPPVAAQA